jgi:Holliday junction resolvase
VKQTKAAGTARELRVVQHFRQRGFVAFRTPASLGVCDVVALKGKLTNHGTTRERPGPQLYSVAYFIECKANKDGGPYSNFRAPERQALIDAARIAGAHPLLCYWPPNREPSFINASEWPEARRVAA